MVHVIVLGVTPECRDLPQRCQQALCRARECSGSGRGLGRLPTENYRFPSRAYVVLLSRIHCNQIIRGFISPWKSCRPGTNTLAALQLVYRPPAGTSLLWNAEQRVSFKCSRIQACRESFRPFSFLSVDNSQLFWRWGVMLWYLNSPWTSCP